MLLLKQKNLDLSVMIFSELLEMKMIKKILGTELQVLK